MKLAFSLMFSLCAAGCASSAAAPAPSPSASSAGCYVFFSRQCGVAPFVTAKGESSTSFTLISPVFALDVQTCPPPGDLEGKADGAFDGWGVAGLAESEVAREQVRAYQAWTAAALREPCTAPDGEDRSTWARFSSDAAGIVDDARKLHVSWQRNGFRGGCAGGYEAPRAARRLPTLICPR